MPRSKEGRHLAYLRFKAEHGCSESTFRRRHLPKDVREQEDQRRREQSTRPVARARANRHNANTRFQLKVETLEAYGGITCACCGEQDMRFLTLDHINNDGAAHRRFLGSRVSGFGFYWYLRKHGFPNDPPLQVHCYNCNMGKTANKGLCPHKDGR